MNKNVIAFYKSIGIKQLNKDLKILIGQDGNKVSIVSVYVNDFFLIANIMIVLDEVKKLFANKYNIKNLREVKTIIGW